MHVLDSSYYHNHFYVGGIYADDENDLQERMMKGRMYVEQLIPLGDGRYPLPLIFMHGGQ